MQRDPIHFLKAFKLRNTQCRKDVLNLFFEQENISISQGDIEKILGDKYDRATIYRTLMTFEEKGIIHRVIVEGHGAQFALCQDNCGEEGHHHHDHIHFKCTSCEKTECLNDASAVSFDLPDGYHKKQANFLVIGLCAKCS